MITSESCPKNHYCPKGSKAKRICPPGTFRDGTEGKTEDDCSGCEAGESCYNDPDIPTTEKGKCARGHYCLKRTYFPQETPCPDGTYAPTRHTESKFKSADSPEPQKYCLDCKKPGKYCLEGSIAPTLCEKGYKCVGGAKKPCPAGKYSEEGADDCIYCKPGHICPEGYHEINPIQCPKGTFMSHEKSEATSCERCTQGHHCPNNGMKNPIVCSDGLWSVEGQTSCSPCPGGYYCSGGTKTECSAGKYCPSGPTTGSITETPCTDGYYCPPGSERELQCPPGTKSKSTFKECENVEAGKSSERDDSRNIVIEFCEEGFYCEPGSGSPKAKACPPGTYSEIGTGAKKDCKKCVKGFYCPGGTGANIDTGPSKMIICPRGHYCPEGSSTPEKCKAGSFNPVRGITSQNECVKCTPGRVCSQKGLSSPDYDCDPGYYCTRGASISQPIDGEMGDYCKIGHYCPKGSSKPIPCAEGKFNVFIGSKSESECLNCPFGFVCKNDGSRELCESGLYCPEGTSPATVKKPGMGYHAIQGQGNKIPCIPGTFNEADKAEACTKCTAGYTCPHSATTPYTGSKPMIPCVPGSYCDTGSVTSKLCPEGTYRESSGAGSIDDCEPCAKTRACEKIGMTTSGSVCEAGYFCLRRSFSTKPGYTGYSKTTPSVAIFGPCPKGHYCQRGVIPTKCPEGTFYAGLMATNLLDCNECLPGKYCKGDGLSTYSGPCPAGHYCQSGTKYGHEEKCTPGHYCPAESPIQRPCPAGKYQNEPEKATCKLCRAGRYCKPESINDETRCPEGYYCPEKTGYYQLTPCPPGTYASTSQGENEKHCLPCPDGKYCKGYGNKEISGECEPGYYCLKGKATSSRPTIIGEGDKCTAGYYCKGGSGAAIKCPAPFVCNQEILKDPPELICNDGFFCGDGLAYTNPVGLKDSGSGLCKPGSWCVKGKEEKCGVGSYLPSRGAGVMKALHSVEECLVCPYGFYCPTPGLAKPKKPDDPGYFYRSGEKEAKKNICQKGFECKIGAIQQVPCDKGTFQSDEGQEECKECDSGKYCQYGSTSGTESETLCEVGMHCPETKMEGALPCKPKEYQDTPGSTGCKPCTDGKYCDRYGLNKEMNCPGGYWCDATQDSGKANMCEPGYYCPENSKEQIKCKRGHYCADYGLHDVTGKCEGGYICRSGSKVPNPVDVTQGHICRPGFYCPEGATKDIACPIGTYNPYEGASKLSDCLLCPEGRMCKTEGLPTPRAPEDFCPEGYYCETVFGDVEGTIILEKKPCDKGFRCPAGVSKPILCLPGSYQDKEQQSDCKTCPAGNYCDFDTSISPPGPITISRICPKGFYCPGNLGSLDDDKDEEFSYGTGSYGSYPCPEGTYGASEGLQSETQCKKCTPGHYCDKKGMKDVAGPCMDGYLCKKGSKVPMKADEMCDKNKYCVGGVVRPCPLNEYTYGTVKGATSANNCMKCLPGKICQDHDTTIIDCSSGFYCTDGTEKACTIGHHCPSGIGIPISCRVGSYSDQEGLDKCKLCLNGNYCDEVQMSDQKTCTGNMVCIATAGVGSARQMPCTYGMRKNTNDNCLACNPGKWCWPSDTDNIRGDCDARYVCQTGASSPSPYSTVLVSSDTTLVNYNGRTPRGTYTAAGASVPIKCPIGTYMPSMGALECIDCPPGHYCDETGIYDLTGRTCTAGYVCAASSTSATAQACLVNHYCPQGTSFNVRCEDGKMATGPGYAECVPCDAGYSCTSSNPRTACVTNNIACVEGTGIEPLCQVGTYLSGGACVPCPPGLFCLDGRSVPDSTDCGTTAANSHGQCCTAGFICTGGSATSKPLTVGGRICDVGVYCSEGATTTMECPIARYIFSQGSRQESDCTNCMEGYVCHSSNNTFNLCYQGHNCPTGVDGAVRCPKGTYLPNVGSKIVHDCISCPAGYLCNGEGVIDFRDYECPEGHYCLRRSQEAITCPYGSYNDRKGGSSVRNCKACPSGYYCPDLGQSDGTLYKCGGGQICNEGSAHPSICPGGYYCDMDANIFKEICPINYYCPPGTQTPIACSFGEMCPEGSAYPRKCVAGQISIITETIFMCEDCPPGTYSESGLNEECDICEPGHVCLGATNVKYPWYKDVHKGYKCPEGAYCPSGSSRPIYCPAGSYNPIEGSADSKACLLCEAGTYNPVEGQSSCLACGDSATSEIGAPICQCKGKNRAFLVTDSSCRCKPGYQYLETGLKLKDENSKVDCQPIIYPRCAQKESRSVQGECTSADDCSLACNGAKGIRSPTLGICQCENIQKVDHVCNRGCRNQMPAMTIDGKRIRINRADDIYNRNPTYIDPRELENFNRDYMSCPEKRECKARSVHFHTDGTIGSSYGLTPRLAAAYQTTLADGRLLDEDSQRRFLQTVSSEEIVNPVMCIQEGDSVVFEIDGRGHYPVYQKDSLLNSNQNFDYAPFKILAEQIVAQIANGELDRRQYFAYTFTEGGRYFFSDSIDPEQTVIIYVTKESEKCASESAYLQPRSTGPLSVFGLALNDAIMLEPDYILMAIIIVSFIFTLAMLLILMKWVTDHIWKPKDITNPLFREVQKDFVVDAATLMGANNRGMAEGVDDKGIFKDVERGDGDNMFVSDLIEGINIQKLEELDPFIIEKILGAYQKYKDYLRKDLLKESEKNTKEIEALSSALEKVKFMLDERYEKLIELLKLDVDYTKLTNIKIKAEEEKEEIKTLHRKIKPSDIKLCRVEEKKATEILKKVLAKRNEANVFGESLKSEEAKSKSAEELTSKAKQEFEKKLGKVEGLTDFEKEKLRDELSTELLDLEYVLVGEREQQEIAIRRILQGRRKKLSKRAPIPIDLNNLSPEEAAIKNRIEKDLDEEGKAQVSQIEQTTLKKIQKAKGKLLTQLGAPANLSEKEKDMILQNHQEKMEQLLDKIKQEKDEQLKLLKTRLEKQKREDAEKKIRELREELNPEVPADEDIPPIIEIPQEIAEDPEIQQLKAEEEKAIEELKDRQNQEKKKLSTTQIAAIEYKENELEEDLQLEIEKEIETKKERAEEKYRVRQQGIEKERRDLRDQLLYAGSDKKVAQKLMDEIKVKDDELNQLLQQEKKEQNFLLEEKASKRRIAKEKKMITLRHRQQDQAIELKLEQQRKQQEVQGKYELEKVRKIVQKAKQRDRNEDAYKLFEQLWNEKENIELGNMFGRQLAEKESKLRAIYKKNIDEKLLLKKGIKDKYKILYNDLEARKTSKKQEDYTAKHKQLRIEEENDLKEMDIKEAMSHKKEEFALRQELEEKSTNELSALQDKLAGEKIALMRELFGGERQEEIDLQNKIADMKDLIEREKDRKIKEIELSKKLILEKYESDIKQRYSSYEDIIKKQREVEKLIKDKKGSIAKMIEERKKQISELKDKALFTPEEEKKLIEKHQKELKELETAMEAERNRQYLLMKAKLEERQGLREREESYNKKKVAFLMGAVGKNIQLAEGERELMPAFAEPKTELERAIERWRKDMREREKSQKATTFQTLQRYLENVGKFRQKGLEGIYLQGDQYQKYLKLMKASKILHKKLEELHRIKANGVLLDLKAALDMFTEDDFDRIRAKHERIGGGYRCFDEEGNILWQLYKFLHGQ